MISDNWTSHFRWRGDGEMPAEERRKLRETVEKVHAAGRVVRFWGTPENEAVWRELRAAGVDLIGTDQLDRLATFLRHESQ
jgi:glycerophosphoryl diester phosphodiesterase